MRPYLAFAAVLAGIGVAVAADAPLPTGTFVDRVVCRDDATQSYALFLPPGYSPDGASSWPILYLFDARARGAVAAKLFAPGAAAQGVIVASSNNTESDSAMGPNVTAFRALWRDTHARFSIDPKRVYAGGFSGGARVATLMASTAPGTVAGVIGCGAGFHRAVRAKPPFVYFGTVGDRDFNYDEMRELDATLDKLGAPRHIEVFDGEHGWPPAELCTTALEWMRLQAERAGFATPDPSVGDRLRKRFADRAANLERSGRILAAMREYRRAAADFRGRVDVSALEQALTRLESSAEGRRALREEKTRIARDDDYREHLNAVWGEIRSGESLPAERIVQELDVAALRARAAKDPGSEDSLSAERLLSEIYVQTSFYLARGYRDEKNYTRALLCLSVASEIRPKSPGAWYEMAALESIAGHPSKAIDALEAAATRGFADAEGLEHDADFDSLRGQDRYRALLARLRSPTPPPSASPRSGR